MRLPLRASALALPLLTSSILMAPTRVSTVVIACLAWVALAVKPRFGRALLLTVSPLLAFMAWAALSVTWSTPNIDTLQSLLVLAAMTGLLLLAASEGKRLVDTRTLDGIIRLATGIACILFGGSLLVFEHGTGMLQAARGFSLFTLLLMAWHLAAWRHGDRRGFWWALLLTVFIGASLSRIAFATAVVLFAFSRIPVRGVIGWLRVGGWGAIAAAALAIALSTSSALRNRFFEGDVIFEVGGIPINATGRGLLWGITALSAMDSPVLGKGAGSAHHLLSTNLPGVGDTHNDYLRIFHDFGAIGLGIWIIALLTLVWATKSAWSRAVIAESPYARFHLTGFLALVAVAIPMTTDNPFVYIFVMAPLGVLVGLSLGLRRLEPPGDPGPVERPT